MIESHTIHKVLYAEPVSLWGYGLLPCNKDYSSVKHPVKLLFPTSQILLAITSLS